MAATFGLAACSADTSGGTPTGGGSASGSTSTSGGGGGESVSVLMVGNPQMKDIQTLAPDTFTKETGITVNFTVLPENELRDKVAQDVATQAGQYDVVTIGAYEGSVWTANDWLVDLQDKAEADTTFDVADIMPAMKNVLSKDGDLYAIPFYGESAFTMYRKDIFEKYNLTMPDKPTWQQIADFAKTIDEGENGAMSGICLRGLPGWGENMAVVGSMLNSFGGGFFDKDYNAMLTSDADKKAVQYYVDTVTKYGEDGAAQAGFTECLNNFSQGKSAIWFDATSAANTVESPDLSKVAGKVGYADAPSDQMRSGWVWAWAWAVPKTTKNLDDAWKFISWASGKEYENTAGSQLGWTRVPDGKRLSTFEIPEYQEATAAYSKVMQAAIASSDPTNCGTYARPAPGCQYLAIPEFADLGTKIGQEISAAVAGQESVDDALAKSQQLAEQVAAAKK
jgi:sorbitol/mannitol transport system substrate-binding protein